MSRRRGDIVLICGSGFVSHMVKVITKSEWSHAGWVISDEHGLESDWEIFGPKGVQTFKLADYEKIKHVYIRVKNVDSEKLEGALGLAFGKMGQRYDWSKFMGLFWSYLTGWFRKEPVRNQGHGWICSELVATPLYQAAGYLFTDESVDYRNVTPGDIYQAVELGKAEIVPEEKKNAESN